MTKDFSRYPEKSAYLIVFIYGIRAFTVECNDGFRKGGRGEGKVEGGITLILDQRAANFFSLKSKFAKSKTFMEKQNNIVEKNVLRKINLVSCHGWIDCKLLTLATRYACCYKVSSVISGLQTAKVITIETKTLKWKYSEHGEIVFSSSELPRIIRKKDAEYFYYNIIGDELLLNFGARFQR